MKTFNAVTIAAVAIVGAMFAFPAQAREGDDSGTPYDDRAVLSHLRSRGVPAIELAPWGDQIRATVVRRDGMTEFQFFDADTFQRIDITGGKSRRVVSELDSRHARFMRLMSLTWTDPDTGDDDRDRYQ